MATTEFLMESPLRGKWAVLNPPGHPELAYDFLAVGRWRMPYSPATLLPHFVWRVPVERTFAWDQPVFAPVDGSVVAVQSDAPDRRKTGLLLDLFRLLRARPPADAPFAAYGGNYIVIRSKDASCDAYVLLAHLKQGSVRVRAGDSVSVGMELGRVGNSGLSIQPHLHLQVMSTPEPLPLFHNLVRFRFRQAREIRNLAQFTFAGLATLMFVSCASSASPRAPAGSTNIPGGSMATLTRTLKDFVEGSDTPGLQYLRVGPEGIRFQYEGGSADLAARKPVQADSLFSAYSLTKTFTAAAVLRLIDQGKLLLEDSLDKYVPESPYGPKVRIRHLLAQTSGIPNPIPLKWVHLARDHARFDEQAELRATLKKHPELSFEPGEKYLYSNISYWLLGRVIESVSGKSYTDFMEEAVIQPLGVSGDLRFGISPEERWVKGYLPKWSWMNLFKVFVSDSAYWGEYESGWLHVQDHFLNGPAFGGLMATSKGVGRFLADQLSEKSALFSESTRRLFMEQQRDLKGELVPMTAGWHVDELNGETYLYKEGGGMGFHAEMRLYPSRKMGTVLLVNSGSFNTRKNLSQLDRSR